MPNSRLAVIPKTGLAGLKENWRSDLQAGFLVFLIALPLSLGIAVASGFPASAGIITAIIGGLLVSQTSGAFLTINGPAAGLITVLLTSVQILGEGDSVAGYHYTLAAIVMASTLQILLGFFKMGQICSFIPTSIIHGMLAAIGIIIITTQSQVMLGVPSATNGNVLSVMTQIPDSLSKMNLDVVLISFLSLLLLLTWPLINSKIPSQILVVLIGVIFAWHFDFAQAASQGLSNYLISIPDNFFTSFTFPDFSKITTLKFWGAVLSISLIGSMESLLITSAVDKLDPYHRSTDLDKNLTAIGWGNLLAGFLGGLPMINEIIRSSANINHGAKTAWSNFFHGLFLLLFVAFFTPFLKSIPLAALAALLVYTGYQLTSPKLFAQVKDTGKEQLFLFIITIIGVLTTDLLVGVAIGIIAKLLMNMARGVWLKNLFKINFTIKYLDNNVVILKLLGSALFSNVIPLKKALFQIDPSKTIIFDLNESYLIDFTVMAFIKDFKQHHQAKGGHYQELGSSLHTFSDHQLAARLMALDNRK